MMVVEITGGAGDYDALFAEYVAQEKGYATASAWLDGHMYDTMLNHAATRYCADLENCCDIVYPALSMARGVEKVGFTGIVFDEARPVSCCPKCGGAVLTPTELDAALMRKRADKDSGSLARLRVARVRKACEAPKRKRKATVKDEAAVATAKAKGVSC